MRGASALEELLAGFPDAPVRLHVVWLPALKTDFAPPLNKVLGLIDDPRAVQYWDPKRIVSADIVRAVNEGAARYGFEEELPPDFIVWDVVAVFDGSARWERDLPPPAYYGGPVIVSIEEARKAVAQQLTLRVSSATP